MPIYEYVCPQCKTEFELRLSYSQIYSTALCPKCYSAAERLISSFACKTGGNIQAAEQPFRKQIKEAKRDTRPLAGVGSKETKRTGKERGKKK